MTDSVQLVEEALDRLQPRGARFVSKALDALDACARRFTEMRVDPPPADIWAWWLVAENLKSQSDRLPSLLHDFEKSLGLKASELTSKVRCLQDTIAGVHHDCRVDDALGSMLSAW